MALSRADLSFGPRLRTFHSVVAEAVAHGATVSSGRKRQMTTPLRTVMLRDMFLQCQGLTNWMAS